MKQKLKEKINVGDKVRKPSFQKCVKMSKEFDQNLKNGDSVISNNHTQQQQKLNNADRDATTKAIVGGRLQFYKGKLLPFNLHFHLKVIEDDKKNIKVSSCIFLLLASPLSLIFFLLYILR